MPASPADKHSVVVCSYAHSLCYSGTTQFADHLCVFERKCFLKSVTSVINLNAFYCEVVHLSTTKIACSEKAGSLIGTWHKGNVAHEPDE